jgi:hypothetical protein
MTDASEPRRAPAYEALGRLDRREEERVADCVESGTQNGERSAAGGAYSAVTRVPPPTDGRRRAEAAAAHLS